MGYRHNLKDIEYLYNELEECHKQVMKLENIRNGLATENSNLKEQIKQLQAEINNLRKNLSSE